MIDPRHRSTQVPNRISASSITGNTPTTAPSLSHILADLAAVGPFFELRDGVAERAEGRRLRPAEALFDELPDRIARTRTALGAEGILGSRIAASITAQGLAAKLVSGPVAAVAQHGLVPDMRPETLWWSATPTGDIVAVEPFRFLPARRPTALHPLVDEVLEPLVTQVRRLFAISEIVLWGNIASSVAGAKRMLDIQRPDLGRRVAQVAADLLNHPMLAGTGEQRPPVAPDLEWTYYRRSCCLYYRLPGAGTCADCLLQNRGDGD